MNKEPDARLLVLKLPDHLPRLLAHPRRVGSIRAARQVHPLVHPILGLVL